MQEIVDGQRNVLHVAIDKMAPTSKKDDKFSSADLELECRNALDMVVDAISSFCDEAMGKRLRIKVSQKLDARHENNSRSSVIRKPIDVLPNLSWEPESGILLGGMHDAMNLTLGKSKGEHAEQGSLQPTPPLFNAYAFRVLPLGPGLAPAHGGESAISTSGERRFWPDAFHVRGGPSLLQRSGAHLPPSAPTRRGSSARRGRDGRRRDAFDLDGVSLSGQLTAGPQPPVRAML